MSKKVWFITGASRGLGKALTEQLLTTTNACVVATARTPETLQELQSHYPTRLLCLPVDVTQITDIQHAVKRTIEYFHQIDIVK